MAPSQRSRTPGDTTIYAVAERAGVSTATVSRALAGSSRVASATRERVLQAARELQYLPDASARALAGRRTGALGIVLPHIDGPYYAELLVGFEIAASELDLSVVIALANPKADSRRSVRGLAGRVDALAFMARSSADDDLVADLARRRPVLTAARGVVEGTDALFAENRTTARSLTDHLLDHGRTRLAFVGRPEPASDIGQRYEGFRDALAARSLIPAAEFAVDPVDAAGTDVADRLLDEDLAVDAVVCGNDELALALSSRLSQRGIEVPRQIAIVGWDDTAAARYISPGLTTVRQPVREMGALAARTLASRIAGAEPEEPTTLASHIVLRSSCGCPAEQSAA